MTTSLSVDRNSRPFRGLTVDEIVSNLEVVDNKERLRFFIEAAARVDLRPMMASRASRVDGYENEWMIIVNNEGLFAPGRISDTGICIMHSHSDVSLQAYDFKKNKSSLESYLAEIKERFNRFATMAHKVEV